MKKRRLMGAAIACNSLLISACAAPSSQELSSDMIARTIMLGMQGASSSTPSQAADVR
jgi:hypothetical protein